MAPADINLNMRHSPLPVATPPSVPASGIAELVVDSNHFHRIKVRRRILKAETSLDISTADFKAMLVPDAGGGRRAVSIVQIFRRLAERGVEIRLLHAGTPSSAALRELKRKLPGNLTIRRCPRLHAKAVVIDARRMPSGAAQPDRRGPRRKSRWPAEFRDGNLDRVAGDDRCRAGRVQRPLGRASLPAVQKERRLPGAAGRAGTE